jgi:hypothetical protein
MPAASRKRRTLNLPAKDWPWPGTALLATILIAITCPSNGLGAEDSAPPAVPSGAVITVPLEYQEMSFAFLYRNVPNERQTNAFPKEPAPVAGHVVRGVLKFGDNPSNAIPFIWQTGAKKLYLDLNRNRDLTDDADGVFSGKPTGPQFATIYHQLFTNLHLAFPATSDGAPILVDFDLFQNGDNGSLFVGAKVHSFWQGRVTVNGHDWQVGLAQNLSGQPGSFRQGQLLLRPWEKRDKPFFAGSEVPEDTIAIPWTGKNQIVRASDAFAFSPKVFFEERAWQLDWSAEPRNSAEHLALRLTEQPTALGELRLSGSFIQRLVLTGGPYVVVLNQPPATVRVPPGRYQPYRVWLKQDKALAYLNFGLPRTGKANVVEPESGSQLPVISPPPSEQAVAVTEQQPATLAVGGPLTNCVSATQRGRNLLLSYRLIGAGGGDYWLAGGGDGKPPQFTAGKPGRQIGSGQFEFG